MSVMLGDVVVAVRHGDAALVGESCGYLVLGAADLALQMPRLAQVETVLLTSDGGVELNAAPCTFSESEMSLRSLLGQLLRFARTPSPNLMRVAERTAPRGLELFILELEAALVPVNRRAARRSLSRLAREVARSEHRANVSADVQERQAEQVVATFDEQASPTASAHEVSPELSTKIEVMSCSPAPVTAAAAPSPQPAPVSSGRVETTTQVIGNSPIAAAPQSTLARLLTGRFISSTPPPVAHELASALYEPQAALAEPEALLGEGQAALGEWSTGEFEQALSPSDAKFSLSEPDLFDDLLDECPTQIFHAQLCHDVSESTHGTASQAKTRTLTPPVPVERMLTPRLPEEASADLARRCIAPPQTSHFTELVTRPGDDVLILSPCAPVVMDVSALEAHRSELAGLKEPVLGLEVPTIAESHTDEPYVSGPHVEEASLEERVPSRDEFRVDDPHLEEQSLSKQSSEEQTSEEQSLEEAELSLEVPTIAESHMDEHVSEPRIEEQRSEEQSSEEQSSEEPVLSGAEHNIDESQIDEPQVNEPHLKEPSFEAQSESSPQLQRKTQPFYRPRLRSRAPIAAHVSLIPHMEETPRHPPSDIEEILNRRLPSVIPEQELFNNLQTLSRVELSPNAPPVALVKTR